MDDAQDNPPPASLAQAVDRVTQLEAELESSSDVTTSGDSLARARAELHSWVDSVTAVIATPGVGRVVLIHADDSETRIASPGLPMLLAEPVRWD